jgi:hypothetical protein
MADDYEVGFGKPPKETQFTKGKSGNPAGRPPGTKNVMTIYREIIEEQVEITQNGRPRNLSSMGAIVLQLTTKAASGDMSAIREIRRWQQIFGESADKEIVDTPDREKDAAAMKRILARFAKPQPTGEEPKLTTENDDDEPTTER